jgi:hypothetical protein
VGELTLRLAATLLSDFDERLLSIETVLRQWQTQSASLYGTVDRMSWLLDGWDFLIGLWDSVAEAPLHDQMVAMTGILRILPLVPGKEFAEEQDDVSSGMLPPPNRMRMVRLFQSWKTGEMDIDLMARLEAAKAAAA